MLLLCLFLEEAAWAVVTSALGRDSPSSNPFGAIQIQHRPVNNELPYTNNTKMIHCLFSLEKRRLWGDLTAAFQYLKGAYKQEGSQLSEEVDNSRMRGNGLKLRREDLGWMSGGSSLLWDWWGARTGCLERLWMPHPWRCSRPGWMGSWAAWSSIKHRGWWPCLWQGDWRFMILEVPSNLGHSVILCEISCMK